MDISHQESEPQNLSLRNGGDNYHNLSSNSNDAKDRTEQLYKEEMINPGSPDYPEKSYDEEEDSEERVRKTTCSACHERIADEFIMRVANKSWHATCLKCSHCDSELTKTCYYRHGKLLCASDFNKESSSQCSGCHENIEQSELIQKSGGLLYHLECFHCIVCGQQLNPGDEYYLLNVTNKLVCKMDFETTKAKGYDGNKRPRTTISAKQLEALKKAYKESNKPARHVRERLSLQTGLDMRVVQVWFQNRRAKEKRVGKEIKVGGANYDYLLDELTFMTPAVGQHTQWPPVSSVHVEHGGSVYGSSEAIPAATFMTTAALTHGLSFHQQFGGPSTTSISFDYHS